MNNNDSQICMFGTLIKEDVWSLKLDKTKGNREIYIDSFEIDINEWLKDIPDRPKVERFKRSFYSSLFNEDLMRGLYTDMTAAEIYGYEFAESGMDLQGIKIDNTWFYEGSYISLKGYYGVIELVISKITDEFIEVTHRFGPDKYYKKFSSIDELAKAAWSLEDLKALDKSLEKTSDDELFNIRYVFYRAHCNFDYNNKSARDYIDSLSQKCNKEIQKREYKIAIELSKSDLLNIISQQVYNNCWDTVKISIDSDSKSKAVAQIARYKSTSGYGFYYQKYKIGWLDWDTKGVTIKMVDNRILKFSYSLVYDSIKEKEKPRQIDIFTMLTAPLAG